MQSIKDFGNDILEKDTYQSMKSYIQHGTVSVLEHSIRVAETSLKIGKFLKDLGFSINLKDLVRGALLHDYFLYDWHKKEDWHKWHGFHHADTALKNASRDFELTEIEKEIIRCHMFPLNITKIPKVMEAWIVTMADKYCSTVETLAMRNKKERVDNKSNLKA